MYETLNRHQKQNFSETFLIQFHISLLAGLRFGCGGPKGGETASFGDLFLALLLSLLQTRMRFVSLPTDYKLLNGKIVRHWRLWTF